MPFLVSGVCPSGHKEDSPPRYAFPVGRKIRRVLYPARNIPVAKTLFRVLDGQWSSRAADLLAIGIMPGWMSNLTRTGLITKLINLR
jgi:hypothetical protein